LLFSENALGSFVKITLSNKLRITQIPAEMRNELVSRLQFTNPKWIENQRMGRWNRGTPRQLKFYSRHGSDGLIVPRGFMRQLLIMSRKHGLQPDIEDRRRKLPDIACSFKAELKPFQHAAVHAMLARDFGTLSAPTGSGKTVMAIALFAQRRQPALVIVHTKELAFQWLDRIETFLGIPRSQVGFIGDGKKKFGAEITVAMVQTLYKCTAEAARHCGHLIVDECHRTPSRTFTEAVTAFDSHYMLGLSATPWRRDQLSQLIFWHLGDIHHEVDKSDLIADGHILDLEIIERVTEFKPFYDPVKEYSKMLSELTSDDRRNRLIVADIASEFKRIGGKGTCLVLSDRKHHCETLQLLLKHKYHIEAQLLTGELSSELRRDIVQRLNKREIQVLIATGQLVGEGFDCSNLSTLFLTTPVRFSGRVLQYLGRILRPHDGVQRARLYDYVDAQVPALLSAARARQRIYASGR
jgi:superfamily II DNA or RNA helicase